MSLQGPWGPPSGQWNLLEGGAGEAVPTRTARCQGAWLRLRLLSPGWRETTGSRGQALQGRSDEAEWMAEWLAKERDRRASQWGVGGKGSTQVQTPGGRLGKKT